MGHTISIVNATEARQNLFRLIEETAEGGEPVFIKGRRHSAVLISEEEWRGMLETVYLSSVPGMVKSIRKAATEPLAKAKKLQDIDW
jgi:prevent-host-death family protein